MHEYRNFLKKYENSIDSNAYTSILKEMDNLLGFFGSCGTVDVKQIEHVGSPLLKEYRVTAIPDHRYNTPENEEHGFQRVVGVYYKSIEELGKNETLKENGRSLEILEDARKTCSRQEEVDVITDSCLPKISETGKALGKRHGAVEFTLAQLENTLLEKYETLSFMMKEYL